MFSSLLQGFMLGLGAAVPLGPINVLIMSTALRNYPAAFSFGAGAMSADITYLTLLLFGLLKRLNDPAILAPMGVLGAVFLLYMSWGICSDRHDQIDIGETGDTPPVWSNYLKGFALTLFNPYTVVFWLSVSTYIQTAHLWPTWTVLGLFGAILSWITFMPLLIYRTKHLLSQKTVAAISIVSAGVIAFFGVLLLLRTLWEFYGFFR